MDNLWTQRDLPVLAWLVRHFDDPAAQRVALDEINVEGLAHDDVVRAVHSLDRETPPLIVVEKTWATPPIVSISNVTGEAMRRVGAWPTPEQLVDRFVAALEARAESEPDQERRSRLGQVASALGSGLRDVAVDVASAVVTRQVTG